jgi:hypothetical protein
MWSWRAQRAARTVAATSVTIWSGSMDRYSSRTPVDDPGHEKGGMAIYRGSVKNIMCLVFTSCKKSFKLIWNSEDIMLYT